MGKLSPGIFEAGMSSGCLMFFVVIGGFLLEGKKGLTMLYAILTMGWYIG